MYAAGPILILIAVLGGVMIMLTAPLAATGRKGRRLIFGAAVSGLGLLGYGGWLSYDAHLRNRALATGFDSVPDLLSAQAAGFENGAAWYRHKDEKRASARADADARRRAAREEAEAESRSLARNPEGCARSAACLGVTALPQAAPACIKAVEDLAAHGAEWSEERAELRFPRVVWADREAGLIAYVGDAVAFRNGFGQWQTHLYTCVWNPARHTVTDLQIRPGTL